MSQDATRRDFVISIPPELSGDVSGSKEYAKEHAISLLSQKGLYPIGEWNYYQITGSVDSRRDMHFSVDAANKTQLSLL